MAKQSFTSGQTLLASQMTSLQQNDWNWSTTVQTGNYTLAATDAGTREIANSGTAITFTVPNNIFTAGDTVEIHNINTGLLTLAAGTGLTLSSADVLTVTQWQGGTLYFTSASAAIWFPRAKRTGIVQVKSTTKTDTFTTTSGSYTDVTGLSVSITPTSSSNQILVMVTMSVGCDPAVTTILTQLVRGSTAIALGDAGGSRVRATQDGKAQGGFAAMPWSMSFLDSPATTSATTYKVQMLSLASGQTVTVNRSLTDSDSGSYARSSSTITVFEVTP